MFRWPSTVRVRLTLWYSLLLGAPLVAFAFLSYAAFSRALISGTDRHIGDALEAFTRETHPAAGDVHHGARGALS